MKNYKLLFCIFLNLFIVNYSFSQLYKGNDNFNYNEYRIRITPDSIFISKQVIGGMQVYQEQYGILNKLNDTLHTINIQKSLVFDCCKPVFTDKFYISIDTVIIKDLNLKGINIIDKTNKSLSLKFKGKNNYAEYIPDFKYKYIDIGFRSKVTKQIIFFELCNCGDQAFSSNIINGDCKLIIKNDCIFYIEDKNIVKLLKYAE